MNLILHIVLWKGNTTVLAIETCMVKQFGFCLGINPPTYQIIANTKKYLQSDWKRGVQYWPYLYCFQYLYPFTKLNTKKLTFEFRSGKIEMYSLKRK